MKMPWESVIDGFFGLAEEWIEDPDKKNEFNFKVKELEFKLRESLLTTKTTPKTDAFVKLLIAFRDIILPLLRPLGAFCMTLFGAYCHYKGIPMDGAMHAIFDGAFPAWGASRHVHKQKEQASKQKSEDNWWEN